MPPALESTPDAPCVRNCTLDEQDVCLGCGRTLEDILAWHRFDAVEREAALARAASRRRTRNQRQG